MWEWLYPFIGAFTYSSSTCGHQMLPKWARNHRPNTTTGYKDICRFCLMWHQFPDPIFFGFESKVMLLTVFFFTMVVVLPKESILNWSIKQLPSYVLTQRVQLTESLQGMSDHKLTIEKRFSPLGLLVFCATDCLIVLLCLILSSIRIDWPSVSFHLSPPWWSSTAGHTDHCHGLNLKECSYLN